MEVEITVRPGVDAPIELTDAQETLIAALEAAGAPDEARVTLVLSDDAELAALNEAHMGSEGPTDVLSFPLLPPSAFPPHPGQEVRTGETPGGGAGPPGPSFALPPGEPPHLGDIVISVERARAQAEEGRGGQTGDRRSSPADELRLLITHGALHLCGWDHAEREEAAAMRELEERLLGSGGR